MANLIEVQKGGNHITTVRFQRPEQRNAICLPMYRELPEILGRINQDEDTRVVILEGAGGFFSAGADMKEFRALMRGKEISPHDYWRTVTTAHISILRTLKPVVAKIENGAMGAGCAITAWCDFRIANENALFGVPAPKRMGINLGMIDTALLTVKFGASRATELLMRGINMTAEDAYNKGYLTDIAPKDELDTKTKELATGLSRNAPQAMKTAKLNLFTILSSIRLPVKQEEIPWQDSTDMFNALEAFANGQPIPEYIGR